MFGETRTRNVYLLREFLHGGGQGFDSPRLHRKNVLFCRMNVARNCREEG
jgi:hypothetical protein